MGYGKGLCVLANTDKSSKQKDILVLSDACESFSACQWTLSIRPKEISGSLKELRIKEESFEFYLYCRKERSLIVATPCGLR